MKSFIILATFLLVGCKIHKRASIEVYKGPIFNKCSEQQLVSVGSVFTCENEIHFCYFYSGSGVNCFKKGSK